MVELGSSSTAYNGKSAAKQRIDKSSKKCSKRRGWQKRSKKDI